MEHLSSKVYKLIHYYRYVNNVWAMFQRTGRYHSTNSYITLAMWSMCGQCFSVQADITVQTHTLLWLCEQCVGNVSAYRQISQYKLIHYYGYVINVWAMFQRTGRYHSRRTTPDTTSPAVMSWPESRESNSHDI